MLCRRFPLGLFLLALRHVTLQYDVVWIDDRLTLSLALLQMRLSGTADADDRQCLCYGIVKVGSKLQKPRLRI
jgi:hypothetical protein